MNKTEPQFRSSDLEGLKSALIEAGVKFLLPSYVDMHGVSKSKMVPMSHFDRAMAGSELCTGAAVEGVPQDISDEEVAAHPDPASCMIQPWMPEVAWFASNLYCEDRPFEPCSRTILGRVVADAASLGFGMNLGVETEFFVFRDDGSVCQPMSPRHNLDKPAYDTSRLLDNMPWMGELVTAMDSLGWDVYSFDHEDGIGQFEIDFSYSDVMTMADRFVFFRRLANEIARRHGGFASFMPKPLGHYAGSGAHFNMSLFDTGTGDNLFVADDDPRGCGLSTLGYRFVAGLLHHLPTISAVVAPTVNSYKRLILKGSNSGFTWAPVFCAYGGNNRTNTIRIPGGGGRVELRLADSSSNPYLAAAMVLAAGLEGIREELDPGEPHRENLYVTSEEERAAAGVATLPRTLGEALDSFASSALAHRTFGGTMFDAWLASKRDEWLGYLNHVSDWERSRYLRFF